MKHIVKALVVASALAATAAAHAEIKHLTMPKGVAVFPGFDSPGTGLREGSGTLVFSAALIGALEVAAIQTNAVVPAAVEVMSTEAGALISASAPVTSVSGDFDTSTGHFSITRVATAGGAMLIAPKKNFATTKGSLSLTGITVDLGTKAIFADLVGGNGVGTVSDVHVWTYTNIEGASVFPPYRSVDIILNDKLTGLVITDHAFNLFAKSLGLTNGGIAAMREIDDYGVMDSRIVIGTVPEPSSYLMVGAGLVGLAFASRRARRA